MTTRDKIIRAAAEAIRTNGFTPWVDKREEDEVHCQQAEAVLAPILVDIADMRKHILNAARWFYINRHAEPAPTEAEKRDMELMENAMREGLAIAGKYAAALDAPESEG